MGFSVCDSVYGVQCMGFSVWDSVFKLDRFGLGVLGLGLRARFRGWDFRFLAKRLSLR